MTRVPILALTCALVGAALQSTIRAEHETAQITKGTIQVVHSTIVISEIAITGPKGFSFNAVSDSGNSEALCSPCEAGSTISLSTVISPAYGGIATYRDRTYTFDFNNGSGLFSLKTPAFTLPAGDTPEPTTVEFSTSFTVADDSYLFLQSGPFGDITHLLPLSGGGTATATFVRSFDEVAQTYFYTLIDGGLRFEFTKKKKKATAP